MKPLLFIFFLLTPAILFAQDTIVQKSGDVILCKIQKEDSLNVYFSMKREGQFHDTFLKKEDIRFFKYGGAYKDVQPEKISLGIGLGLDYGGVGLNLAYYPHRSFGFFAGFGTALAGPGFNAGLKIRFDSKEGMKRLTPFITMMYGYNAAIKVQNRLELNKIFYGPSFGLGLDFRSSLTRRLYWSMTLLIPVRSGDVDDYIKDLEDNHSVTLKNKLPPIAFSLGATFILNKTKK